MCLWLYIWLNLNQYSMKLIFTLRLYLKKFRILLPIINILVFLPEVYAQNSYSLTLSDNSTYNNNCSEIVPATWIMKTDSCILHTPYLFKWATFSELNCDDYIVDCSFESINFQKIASVDGVGYSTQ